MIRITEKRDILFINIRFTEGISPRFSSPTFDLKYTMRQSETGWQFFVHCRKLTRTLEHKKSEQVQLASGYMPDTLSFNLIPPMDQTCC